MLFSETYREEVRDKIISRAKEDSRILSAAVVGSYARGAVDRWSDIDLTFGVDETFTVASLLESWTEYVAHEFSGVLLFDVGRGSTVYRVFLLPGCLQLDLSFSPAKEFGAIGQHFHLLYGKQYDKPQPEPPSVREIFGVLIHHILRARFCVERNRLWQAEFWTSEARNCALKLACIERGVSSDYGRGFDDLPEELLSLFKPTFVFTPEEESIKRAIIYLIEALPEVSPASKEMASVIQDRLTELSAECN